MGNWISKKMFNSDDTKSDESEKSPILDNAVKENTSEPKNEDTVAKEYEKGGFEDEKDYIRQDNADSINPVSNLKNKQEVSNKHSTNQQGLEMQEEILTDTDEEYTMALINNNEEELINNSIEIRENVKNKLKDDFNSNVLIEVEEVLALERSHESDLENAEEDFNINVLIEVEEQDLAQETIPESDLEKVEEELRLQSLVNQENQNLPGTSTSCEEKVLKRKFV